MILALTRRIADPLAEKDARLDLVGTVLLSPGLGLLAYGVLRSGAWGLVQPKAGAPEFLGLPMVLWLILGGGVVLRIFMSWETHRLTRSQSVLLDPTMVRNRTLQGGLTSFFFPTITARTNVAARTGWVRDCGYD